MEIDAVTPLSPRFSSSSPDDGVSCEGRDGGQVAGDDDEGLKKILKQINFVDSVDEMSAAMAQFRSRRELKNTNVGADAFDQVLEEDVVPKTQQVLKLAQSHGSAAELLRELRKLFPDESDLVLVLRELLRGKKAEQIVLTRLEEAYAELQKEVSPQRVNAGIHCAIKARLLGKRLGIQASLLRESYRQFLAADQPAVDVYEEWIVTYGAEHRLLIVQFIEDALAVDIMSHAPSCSAVEFGAVLERIGRLRLLRSADGLFVASLLRQALVQEWCNSEVAWLTFFLVLLQVPDDSDTVINALPEAMSRNLDANSRAALLRLVRRTCARLPHAIFSGVELLHALLENLDVAAEVEQERLDRRAARERSILNASDSSEEEHA